MRSPRGSFGSSGTRMFLLFLIVALIFSEWSSVASAQNDTQYQRSESYTGIRCNIDRCDESCKSEGNTAGGLCKRGKMYHVMMKCYCMISPPADAVDSAADGALTPTAADGALAPAADDAALAPDASSADAVV